MEIQKKAQIEIQFVSYNYGKWVGQFFKIVSFPFQFFTLLLSLNTCLYYNVRILQIAYLLSLLSTFFPRVSLKLESRILIRTRQKLDDPSVKSILPRIMESWIAVIRWCLI